MSQNGVSRFYYTVLYHAQVYEFCPVLNMICACMSSALYTPLLIYVTKSALMHS